jgi:hypothetical protein
MYIIYIGNVYTLLKRFKCHPNAGVMLVNQVMFNRVNIIAQVKLTNHGATDDGTDDCNDGTADNDEGTDDNDVDCDDDGDDDVDVRDNDRMMMMMESMMIPLIYTHACTLSSYYRLKSL